MGEVLTRQVPDARLCLARAEQLPLQSASVDAVVGSSMWHWVDEPRAEAEIARVLRPGGVLGVLWGGPEPTGALAEMLRAARPRSLTDADRAAWRRGRHRELHIADGVPFGAPEQHVVQWTRQVTADQLVGLTRTYSGFMQRPEAERAELDEQFQTALQQHPQLGRGEAVTMPMRCICWRATRL
jgi:SAM-dependent methyltransferase